MKARGYTITWADPSGLIHSSALGHLGGSQIFAIANRAFRMMGVLGYVFKSLKIYIFFVSNYVQGFVHMTREALPGAGATLECESLDTGLAEEQYMLTLWPSLCCLVVL